MIAALPLFEEANRTRTFMVTILRALAERGVASVLPDLPGLGESLTLTERMALPELQEAFAAATARIGTPHIIALRSGTLVTRLARGASRWLFAPQERGKVVDELMRVAKLGGASETFSIDDEAPQHEIAGNLLSRTLLRDLRDAAPDRTTPSRIVRLASDQREANAKFDGPPLWRKSEPGNDHVLAERLAADIVDWIATCGD
ncbi:MAG: hypothetical protein M3R41_06875 [Pseudomonadota bacterium]|nr:hypothetical protein [Pseudomonadota bacterium]